MKKGGLILAIVLGLSVMLTLCYSSQARAQVSLQCTMNGDQLWQAGTYNILIEADMSVATVTLPGGGNLRYKSNSGKFEDGVGRWCATYVEATGAMYRFGWFCDAPRQNSWRQWKIDRISGEITHTEGELTIKGVPGTYTGTCTKTELPRQKF
jgi:hypothetical protein